MIHIQLFPVLFAERPFVSFSFPSFSNTIVIEHVLTEIHNPTVTVGVMLWTSWFFFVVSIVYSSAMQSVFDWLFNVLDGGTVGECIGPWRTNNSSLSGSIMQINIKLAIFSGPFIKVSCWFHNSCLLRRDSFNGTLFDSSLFFLFQSTQSAMFCIAVSITLFRASILLQWDVLWTDLSSSQQKYDDWRAISKSRVWKVYFIPYLSSILFIVL